MHHPREASSRAACTLPVRRYDCFALINHGAEGFVTLSAFSCGECSGQQASCGGGCRGPSAERTGAKLLEMRSAQQMTLMVECVECGGMDGEETLD